MPHKLAIDQLVTLCHLRSVKAGWWNDATTVPDKYLVATKLALVHSELSEALEGFRKSLADEHLPHHASITVELADALIRIFDLAGYLGVPLGQAFWDKLEYNAIRPDHTPGAREAPGGKRF